MQKLFPDYWIWVIKSWPKDNPRDVGYFTYAHQQMPLDSFDDGQFVYELVAGAFEEYEEADAWIAERTALDHA